MRIALRVLAMLAATVLAVTSGVAHAQPSGGHGSSTHINGERFRLAARIKPVHVAFKGSSDAALEVVAGRVHYVITGLITVMQYVQDGRLVPLGVFAPARSPLLPDVPTLAEVLPGYKRDGSHVMLAPAGTPRPILNQLSQEVRRIFELPDVKQVGDRPLSLTSLAA